MSQQITKIIYTPSYFIQKSQMDNSEVEKLEQAIEVHGYRGASSKKHNGVVNIKPTDLQLFKSLNKYKLLDTNKEILDHIKLVNLELVIDVKVVAHCPSGNRCVGSLYREKNKNNDKADLILYVFGFANYNYSLF
jgi:hypothetical protein